ncbi:MAG: hypothetical protein IJS58_01895 [Bacilli bacterium]|nr:hypothetical protein [Bacilli bacterium]
MEWFEPLIAIGALSLVIVPIIIRIRNKKMGKSSCGCSDCDCCSKKKDCLSNFKTYLNSEEFNQEKNKLKTRNILEIQESK